MRIKRETLARVCIASGYLWSFCGNLGASLSNFFLATSVGRESPGLVTCARCATFHSLPEDRRGLFGVKCKPAGLTEEKAGGHEDQRTPL